MNISALEYQLESEVGSQCEQLRAVGAAQQKDHVPQCSEDGRYRCRLHVLVHFYNLLKQMLVSY